MLSEHPKVTFPNKLECSCNVCIKTFIKYWKLNLKDKYFPLKNIHNKLYFIYSVLIFGAYDFFLDVEPKFPYTWRVIAS